MISVPITSLILLAFLAGAASMWAGVRQGASIRQETALQIENDYLKEELAKMKAETLLAEGKIKLLEIEKKSDDAKGVYISAGADPGGSTLDSAPVGEILKDVSDEEAAGALGEKLFSASKRLQEQMLRAANPVADAINSLKEGAKP